MKKVEEQGRITPYYIYDLSLLGHTLDKLKTASEPYGFKVHYALKANSNPEILRLISESGLGADCVSGNEVLRAIESGFPSDSIAFAGVGKSDAEITIGLQNDIFTFNVESTQEIRVIDDLAGKMGKTAGIALRINPNVNAKTHHYITTGLEENKFGINSWEFVEVLSLLQKSKNIELKGLHFHIGSQITELSVFKGLCLRVNEIQQFFIDHHIIPGHLNVGGGLGVEYEQPDIALIPDFKAFFKVFHEHLELQPQQQVHFELGRAIVAQSGSLVTKVLFVKKGINVNFAIVDAGMTELIRPALYQSFHKIEKIGSESEKGQTVYDVVGPICESSDCFAKRILLPELNRGDLLVIRTTGAYGEVMSSNYNLRTKALAYYTS
ncbi:MAG: diaminopimelate decarboxylase [Vicingaceae bacterium]